MFRFARRAAGFGLQMTLFGLAMATFAIAAVYQKVTDRSEPSESDDEPIESDNTGAEAADRASAGKGKSRRRPSTVLRFVGAAEGSPVSHKIEP